MAATSKDVSKTGVPETPSSTEQPEHEDEAHKPLDYCEAVASSFLVTLVVEHRERKPTGKD